MWNNPRGSQEPLLGGLDGDAEEGLLLIANLGAEPEGLVVPAGAGRGQSDGINEGAAETD